MQRADRFIVSPDGTEAIEGWRAVTLTLTGSQRFIGEFIEAFGDPRD